LATEMHGLQESPPRTHTAIPPTITDQLFTGTFFSKAGFVLENTMGGEGEGGAKSIVGKVSGGDKSCAIALNFKI